MNYGPGLIQPGATPLDVAFTQLGVTEIPLGSNRGPQVDQYLRWAHLEPNAGHYAWCCSFVGWCHNEAGILIPRTAGVAHMWELAAKYRVVTPTVGCVFVHLEPSGLGHMGFVRDVSQPERLLSLDGNTNTAGSREGDRVAVKDRPIGYATGFLKFY